MLDVGGDGNLGIDSSRGLLWAGAGTVKPGEWQHVAFTYQQGGAGDAVLQRQGPRQERCERPAGEQWGAIDVRVGSRGATANGTRFVGFAGLISDIHVYPVALTAAQLAQDMGGTLKTRAPTPTENPVPKPFTYAAAPGSFTKHVGVDVPRSPITVYATSLHAGMSGGFKFVSEQGPGFSGSVDGLRPLSKRHGLRRDV